MARSTNTGQGTIDISQSLVPLRDRFASVSVLRVLFVVVPALAWVLAPSTRTAPEGEAITSLAAYAVAVAASLLFLVLGRTAVRRALQLGGLVDGVWLLWVFHLEGGMRGDAPYLFVLQIAGTTLLSSFRSGVKVALWDTLLLYGLTQAASARLLGAGGRLDTSSVPPFLALLVAAAVVVAAFAAVNERELRRRRNDVEVLHRLAARLERATDMSAVADGLCELACDELDADRALLVVAPDPARPRTGTGPTLSWMRTRVGDVQTGAVLPATFGHAVRRAIERRQSLRQLWIGGPPDPLLGALMAGCERALVVPMWLEAGSTGVLVLDYTSGRSMVDRVAGRLGRSRSAPVLGRVAGRLLGAVGARSATWTIGRHRKLETRQIATAEQACAHTALAMDRASTMAELARVAAFDPLTGLANRRTLDGVLEGVVASGHPYCVAILDLDHFKALNDSAGHDVGDVALTNVAEAIRTVARPTDTAGRLGGEEFLLVMPGTDERQAAELCDRVRRAVEGLPEPRVTVSVGVAGGRPGAHHRATVKAADRALYEAKRSGRNRVVVASAAPGVPAIRTGADVTRS